MCYRNLIYHEKTKSRYYPFPYQGRRRARTTPTTVLEYRPTTHIAQLAQPNWSIVITFDEPMKEGQYSAFCQVRFLFDHAPEYILDELKEMEVYEGAKIVGKIVFE